MVVSQSLSGMNAVVAVRLADGRVAVRAVVVGDTLVGRVRAAPVERVLVRRDLAGRVHHLHAVALVDVDAATLGRRDGGAEVRGPVLAVRRDAVVVRVPPDHVHVGARLTRRVGRQRRAGRRQLRGPRLLRAVVAHHVHVVARQGGAGGRSAQVARVGAVEGAFALGVSRAEDHEAVLVGVDVGEVIERHLDGRAAGHELVVGVELAHDDAVAALEGDAGSARGDRGDGDDHEVHFIFVRVYCHTDVNFRDAYAQLGAEFGVVRVLEFEAADGVAAEDAGSEAAGVSVAADSSVVAEASVVAGAPVVGARASVVGFRVSGAVVSCWTGLASAPGASVVGVCATGVSGASVSCCTALSALPSVPGAVGALIVGVRASGASVSC
jgi:hypothetical protein